ncbi:hypothetical protein [Roseobacter sp.]|uniref:hypothetical protein n=1 Tax=Roseobacter sp. TaxID=1907202 RepID=UPI0029674762|nr:hypothetical protein [Roseobacter sp.]MDW3180861.1 hypothetical protein [Roseobacter sp.]
MIIKWLMGLGVLGVGWLALLASVMLLSNDAPAALVPLATAHFIDALPDHVSITDTTALGTVLVSEDAGFVAQLYEAGAIVVLPAGLMGCAPLT